MIKIFFFLQTHITANNWNRRTTKLNCAEVTIFGLGGLGNLLSTYIASSGIKKINIVDFDVVEETNLQRQINFSSEDIGSLKVDSIENFLNNKFKNLQIKNLKRLKLWLMLKKL